MFFILKITKNLFFYLFFDYAAFLIVLTYSYGLFSQNLTLPSFFLTKNSDTSPPSRLSICGKYSNSQLPIYYFPHPRLLTTRWLVNISGKLCSAMDDIDYTIYTMFYILQLLSFFISDSIMIMCSLKFGGQLR